MIRQERVLHSQERETAAAESLWTKWEEVVLGHLSHIADPSERLVLFVSSLTRDQLLDPEMNWPDMLRSRVLNLLPCSREGRLFAAQCNDDDAVQRWFLDAVQTPSTDQDFVIQGVWKRKTYSLPGWYIKKGARYHGRDIILLADGRRFCPKYTEVPGCALEWVTTEQPPAFNLLALHTMGKLANLPQLPPRPSISRPR